MKNHNPWGSHFIHNKLFNRNKSVNAIICFFYEFHIHVTKSTVDKSIWLFPNYVFITFYDLLYYQTELAACFCTSSHVPAMFWLDCSPSRLMQKSRIHWWVLVVFHKLASSLSSKCFLLVSRVECCLRTKRAVEGLSFNGRWPLH